MRNLFDQYEQPENRVTHALASCLAEDNELLRMFVKWVGGTTVKKKTPLEIVEQRLPGEPEVTEAESESRGLPDIWIHDFENWALVIESKISSTVNTSQLRRHYRTAERRGFQNVTVLAITATKPRVQLPQWAKCIQWTDVYQWLIAKSSDSVWARQVADYLEIAESRFTEKGYMKEGTLTVFSGVPFDAEEKYNYPEAKRVLKLAMDELRARKDLQRQLRMDPKGAGRGMITGKAEAVVWDFLRIKGSSSADDFTKYPHLTVAVRHEGLLAVISVPHRITPEFRRNLVKLGFNEFCAIMESVCKSLERELRSASGAAPWVEVVQRRYPTQSSPPIMDATLRFDLRTAFPSKGKGNQVKVQPQWLTATYDALAKKRSNLQVAVGAMFPYGKCTVIKQPEILDYVAGTWIACKPLLDVMLKGERDRKPPLGGHG